LDMRKRERGEMVDVCERERRYRQCERERGEMVDARKRERGNTVMVSER